MKRKYYRRKNYFIDTIATLLKRLGQIIKKGAKQVMKINLLGKPNDPLVSKPNQEKAKKHWQDLIIPAKMIDPCVEGSIQKTAPQNYKIT